MNDPVSAISSVGHHQWKLGAVIKLTEYAMTILEEVHDDTDDPLRQRIVREMHFRPDDPPEVREALIRSAMHHDVSFHREALERRGVYGER